MKNHSSSNKFYLILILGLLTAIGPLSIDMYLPAFPNIAEGLHTSIASVMLSLSSFFIGISVGQLFYGPLLEKYGRKIPVYGGIIIYAISSLACAFALSAHTLIVFRLFQALGGCVGMVAARAMVRDFFDVKDNAKIFSTLMLVVAISPILGPSLGGFITTYFGWRYVFGALVVFIILILLGVVFLLPETKAPDKNFSLQPMAILKNYWGIFKNQQFVIFTFTAAIAYAGLYAYISGSPFVFMSLFKVTEQHFGWIFAGIAMCLITASQLNTFLLRRFSSQQIIKWALYLQNFAGLILVILSLSGAINLINCMVFIAIFLSCQGFVFPNAAALSMAPFAKNAGTASALMGFIQMSIGALMSAVVSFLQNGTSLPMTGVMGFCSVVASITYFYGRKITLVDATTQLVDEGDVDMVSMH